MSPSHALAIPQTLISVISGAVNHGMAPFLCSVDVNILNQAMFLQIFTQMPTVF